MFLNCNRITKCSLHSQIFTAPPTAVLLRLRLRPAPSDVFGLSPGNLPDALLRSTMCPWAPSKALPRCNKVSVALGVREGVCRSPGTPASLEGRWLFLIVVFLQLHLVFLSVSLDLVSYRGPDGFREKLDADDRQKADAHSKDDG